MIIDLLFQIDTISAQQLKKFSTYKETIESCRNPLQAFASNLNKVIECQAAAMMIKDVTEEHLLIMPSGSLIKPSGVVNACIQSGNLILYRNRAHLASQFDPHADSLGIEEEIESLLCVPIYNFCGGVDGVLVFVNSHEQFPAESVILAQYLSLIPREILQTKDINLES